MAAAISFLWNGTHYYFKDGKYWKRVFVYGEGYHKEDCTEEEFHKVAVQLKELNKRLH